MVAILAFAAAVSPTATASPRRYPVLVWMPQRPPKKSSCTRSAMRAMSRYLSSSSFLAEQIIV